jgi:ribosome biogenesis GTPase
VLACYHDEWDVILDDRRTVRCSIRARHFAGIDPEDKVLAAGDRVLVGVTEAGHCVIEERLERTTTLSRLMAGSRKPREQVIVANAELLVAVTSLASPRLNRRLLDRFLVIAESAGLESLVVLNKTDLVRVDDWAGVAAAYRSAGYPIAPTSAIRGEGVEPLRTAIAGRLAVFAGASGAGKSSLLNAIDPGLGLRVREVNAKTGKGRHTTTNVTLFPLPEGTLVADTPGFRELGLWRIDAEDLDTLFPEFEEPARRCRFRGCSHIPEPGCAVRAAVDSGIIDRERYESYVRLFEELSSEPGRPRH